TNAKNMMPFNSNAAPIKPPPESVVAKKRVSRHGSVLTGTDEPSNYDLEMMRSSTRKSRYPYNDPFIRNNIRISHGLSELFDIRRHIFAAGNMLNHVRSNEMEFMVCIMYRSLNELDKAEQELISIMPYFELQENGGRLNGISGDFGPFHPSTPTQVPLWLALSLKQLQKCRILQPSWFTVAHLKDRLDKETSSELFEELPFHYLEIAALLVKHAADDMQQVETIRLVLEDIQQVRQDKIRNGLVRIAADVQTGGTAYAVQLNNVAAMEINSVRQFMTKSLTKFYGLGAARLTAGIQTQLMEPRDLKVNFRVRHHPIAALRCQNNLGYGAIVKLASSYKVEFDMVVLPLTMYNTSPVGYTEYDHFADTVRTYLTFVLDLRGTYCVRSTYQANISESLWYGN
ncbi:hypothetical protein AaE_011312, partial [Aphanomyces astaci]